MRRVLVASALLVCMAAALRVLCNRCAGLEPSPRHSWKLSGSEILLQLSFGDDKHAAGIYAIDPSEKRLEPKLLIPGGEHPTWNRKRDCFAYLRGQYLWLARKDGTMYPVGDLAVTNIGIGDPPVDWFPNGGFAVKYHFDSVGTLVYPYAGIDPLPADLQHWDGLGPATAILPLTHPLDSTRRNANWDDALAVRNLDVSPDSRRFCAEVSPLSPSDLRRDRAKVFIYDRAAIGKGAQPEWFLSSTEALRKGRRLTSSGIGVCELNPIWSPKGDWIAFQVVNFKEGYVAPAVCRPDGTGYTELLVDHAERYDSFLPNKPRWLPASRTQHSPGLRIRKAVADWGYPCVVPVEWSDDGAHLLLNIGDRYRSLLVARYDKLGRWTMTNAGGAMGGKPTFAAVDFAALGPATAKGCQIAHSFHSTIFILNVTRDKTDSRFVILPRGSLLRWMDW